MDGRIAMKYAKKNRAGISAAVLAVVATAAVACSSSSHTTTTTTSSSPPAKGAPASSAVGGQVDSLFQSGLTQAERKKWSAATTSFQKVLAIDPSNFYADYDLGWIAQSRGSFNEALSYYNKSVAANASYTPAMYNEAILLETSDPRQAIGVYQKIVGIDPRAATAYLRLALVQAEQGDTTDAMANDAKAVSIDHALSRYKLPATN
jgi:tetratricopeptide (TPR) repeat protein